jgi:hypothetical protein
MSSVDTTATVVFLLAFIVASLVIAFDVHLGVLIGNIRTRMMIRRGPLKDDPTLENVPVTGLAPEENGEKNKKKEKGETKTPAGDVADEAPEKKTGAGAIATFFKGETPADGFAIVATVGETYVPPPISILSKNKGKPEVGDVKANMNIIKRRFRTLASK